MDLQSLGQTIIFHENYQKFHYVHILFGFLIGILVFCILQGFYLPWALLALDLIFGDPLMPDILGMVAGHLYYFLTVLHPLAGGKLILKTPFWMYPTSIHVWCITHICIQTHMFIYSSFFLGTLHRERIEEKWIYLGLIVETFRSSSDLARYRRVWDLDFKSLKCFPFHIISLYVESLC